MEKKYVISFFASFVILVVLIFVFVTWMNPNRITSTSWSIDFVTDRNMAYKKFSLIKNNTSYTDLIVGSSTSEVFVPVMIKELYGIQSYLGGTGGSKTPYRLAQINYAIKNNPNLKRIIYIVDLFEFVDTDLETNIYYQKEIMQEIPPDLRRLLKKPDFTSRIQDYFNHHTIRNAFKTFKDYQKYQSGEYKSLFNNDGATEKSMVIVDRKEPITPRVLRIAQAYQSQYKNLKELDSLSVKFFDEIIKTASQNNLEVVFVIAPWHPLFFDYFEKILVENNNIYNKFVNYIRSLSAKNIRVLDFSYPISVKKGILDSEKYWHDGVHFSHKSGKLILDEVYNY